jgi:hypothetical protein
MNEVTRVGRSISQWSSATALLRLPGYTPLEIDGRSGSLTCMNYDSGQDHQRVLAT